MAKISYFRQKRIDGAVRSGIDAEGDTLLQSFEATEASESLDAYDPVLEWYVDVEFEGENLPSDPQGARQWMLENAQVATAWLAHVADELLVGSDANLYPRIYETAAGDGVDLRVRIAVLRRLGGREVGPVVKALSQTWQDRIQELASAPLVA